MSGWTIALKHESQFRKVAKIQGTKEGGFSVIMPYHAARQGLCMKFPFDPVAQSDSQFAGFTPASEIAIFQASRRVKLTYHADGFVHFSGEDPQTIRSGRYPDGSVKGLGIFTAPLHRPVQSGPSIGLLCWGLVEFDELRGRHKGNVLQIDECEYLYRRCSRESWTGYYLEIFVFPSHLAPSVYTDGRGRERIFLAFSGFEGGPAWFHFYVIRIPRSDSFLGFFVSRLNVDWGSPSGFSLSSLPDRHWHLQAVYPIPEKFLTTKDTVDYDPGTINQPLPSRRPRAFRMHFGSRVFVRFSQDRVWIPEATWMDMNPSWQDETKTPTA